MANNEQSQCWCKTDTDEHDERCERSPMNLTKQEFVDAAAGGSKAAIESYLFLVNEEKLTHEEAMEMTLTEADESASCWAGIGSCGGGGCKH